MDDNHSGYYKEEPSEEDELEQIDPIEEGTSQIVKEEVKVNPLLQEGISSEVQRHQLKTKEGRVPYQTPNTHPKTKIVDEAPGVEQVYRKIKIELGLVEEDWARIYRMIKLRREKIKDYILTAIMTYTQELEIYERAKRKEIARCAEAEVRTQIEAEIEKVLVIKKTIWQPRFGKKDEQAGPKTPNDVLADINKERGIEDSDKEEKEKLLERLRKKSIWKPKYTKKPPAILSKVDKSPDEELEEEVDRLAGTDNSNVDDNFIESIKTEGVLPEEKGIPQDAGAGDAPTQEEMT